MLRKKVFRNPAFYAGAAAYALTILVCLLALVWVLKLRHQDFSLDIPFIYRIDGLFNAALIKGLIENGWYLHNSYLGYPTGLTLYDFPMADNLHFLVIKFISFFSHDYAVVMNLFYLATFPLTAVSALFVFRRLKISYPVAAVGSLLFTFVPYHLFRGEGHLFLAGIYIIPLTALAILRFFSGSPPFYRKIDHGVASDFVSLRTAGYIVIALLTASAGVYYAVFALFFLLVAGAYAACKHWSWKPLIAAGVLIGIIGIGIVANLSPTLIYQHQNGRNEAIAKRTPFESYVFAGTITQMLLPATGHRLGFLRNLKYNYINEVNGQITSPIGVTTINENDYSSLGIIGSLGLLLSLGWLILSKARRGGKNKRFSPLLEAAGVLNLTAILLATVGGFGLLFSFLITPQIRAYNRISVYVAFFSIMAVLAVIEGLWRKYARTGKSLLFLGGGLVLILAGGILDQTNNGMVPEYTKLKTAYASDESFFQRIEDRMPPQSHIFQLPYVTFPESEPSSQPDYEHFRAYLHTSNMYWSYGAMKGRDGAQWQSNVASEPAGQMLRDLAAAGFNGIYIDRVGYPDQAAQLEQQLKDLLKEDPLINDDNTLVFFDMTDYVNSLGSGYGPGSASQSTG